MAKKEFKLPEEDTDETRGHEREAAERRAMRKLKDQQRRDTEDFVGQVSKPRPR